MTTVTWVQDGNGNYEVSSPKHLKQLMNEGNLYTDTGPPPSSYWADGTGYIQTADIDLLSDSTDIKPIGIETNEFLGDYDGGNYSISNWSYLDPNFTSTADCEKWVGLFGRPRGVLKNIRLTGVFSLHGFIQHAGFFAGKTLSAEISNIICDFDVGTNLSRGVTTGTPATMQIGSFCGLAQSGSITGVDIKGTIDFVLDGVGTSWLGGFIGVITSNTVSLITISATISGMSASVCAGFISRANTSTISKCINAMTGDITAFSLAGGMISTESAPNSITNIVNAMTGNITSMVNFAGGIMSLGQTSSTYDSLFNYMTGNIIGAKSGGIIAGAASPSTVTNSINAMNGNVGNTVRSTGTISGSVTVNTNFGLTFTSNDIGTSTPLAGFLTIASFPDLPYFLLSGSDTVGNTYDYDFVFANIGGNNTYSTTHLIISGGVGTFQDGAVFIFVPPLVVTPRISSVLSTVTPVTGAIAYRLTSQETGSLNENLVRNNFTDLVQRISSLSPSTEYTFRLYSTTGSVYVLEYTETVTTLANSASNYEKTTYGSNGKFDLTVLDDSSFALLGEVMNEVFTTGEELEINIGPRKSKVAFVKRGESVSTDDSILVPFSSTAGSGQSFTMNLSDSSEVSVAYDETDNSLNIGGATVQVGDSIVIDGKKLTASDI